MKTLTRSTVLNFCLGMVAGAIFSAMLVSHVFAKRVERQVSEESERLRSLDTYYRKLLDEQQVARADGARLQKQEFQCTGALPMSSAR